jgi:hypothetical protein
MNGMGYITGEPNLSTAALFEPPASAATPPHTATTSLTINPMKKP